MKKKKEEEKKEKEKEKRMAKENKDFLMQFDC